MIHGRDIIIKDANGNAVIAASRSCTVQTRADMTEVTPTTGADSDSRCYIAGRKSWSVTLAWLVTAPSTSLIARGKTVQVVIMLSDEAKARALTFAGRKYISTIQQSSLNATPTAIWWDTNRQRFVGEYGGAYYLMWTRGGYVDTAYISPQPGALFIYGSQYYAFTGTNLELEDGLYGTAFVEEAEIAAAWGNLATGSWRLRGTGALRLMP